VSDLVARNSSFFVGFSLSKSLCADESYECVCVLNVRELSDLVYFLVEFLDVCCGDGGCYVEVA